MLRGLQCRSVAPFFLHIFTLLVFQCECCPLILDKLSVTCCLSEDTTAGRAQSVSLWLHAADNPKIWTQCGHHFHLACIYEWLERKQTCPLCDIPMGFEEIL